MQCLSDDLGFFSILPLFVAFGLYICFFLLPSLTERP